VVILRSWHATVLAAFLLGSVGSGICSASGRAANVPSAIGGIERNLGSALARAETKQLLRFHRHRVNTSDAPVDQVVWVNLATGQRRVLDYDASGRLTSNTLSSPTKSPNAKPNASGVCTCDLDPFTNFREQELHTSLLGDQTIDGKPTFHLRFTVTGGMEPSTTDFWINRSTYLPLRSKVVYRVRGNGQLGPNMTTTDQFIWLPRTSANLAELARG
jgi:YD repeat-containing protein